MADYNLESLNIMIVDDNRHMRFLVKTILNSLGVRRVYEAEDGQSGLRSLRDFEADIVICDWKMEPMDGIEFTYLIRNGDDSPNVYVPIIMLTGHTELNRVTEARDAGVNEFLAKPVSVEKLYKRIKTILESPRQFIRTTGYFGPDRRRRDDPSYMGPERRRR